ncbi:inositol phosphate phosphatase SopB [Providencia burhodogranariea]|uniref:Inositol phosphate phosphatase SopB n=1 Tax=Providencia burhodogranariea DSM 19968 TaxID=1141662 RepID=K8W9Q8_9GAMM|nr:inositol phosphate phosphatase SopB [Providencia burhodogranariea]EKT57289.1 inositol phosphate phosphatase SopB [Providencia burhodogranariea DSM 19968]
MNSKNFNTITSAVYTQRLPFNTQPIKIKNQPLLKNIKSTNNTTSSRDFSLIHNLMKSIDFSSKYSYPEKIIRSQNSIINYQKDLIEVAKVVLIKSGNSDGILNDISIKLSDSVPAEDRSVKKHELSAVKSFKDRLIKITYHEIKSNNVQKNHISLKKNSETFNNELKAFMNNKEWKTINTKINYNNTKYPCTLIPASQMKFNSCEQDIFHGQSYNNKGISSKSSDEVTHAVNLWISDIQDDKKNSLFTGIRHGVLSPFALAKGSQERKEGAKNRAKEVVMAALFSQPDLYKKALNNETVELKLSSTSLLTNRWEEANMIKDQVSAWKDLGENNVIKLNVRNEDGQLQEVKVKLDVAIFNFGVNEIALKLPSSQKKMQELNSLGLTKLLGDDFSNSSKLNGWVGDYLSKNPDLPNKEKIIILSEQVKTIWNKKNTP